MKTLEIGELNKLKTEYIIKRERYNIMKLAGSF